jgi:DNA replication protein DnaC
MAEKQSPNNNQADEKLKKLFLFHMARQLPELEKHAVRENLSHREFLNLAMDHELACRHQNTVARLVRKAGFPNVKTIDAFDWSHPTSIPKALILNACNMDFVRRKEHLILLGPSGTGKTHLAEALGFIACQNAIRTQFTTAADMINHLIASKSDRGLERGLKKYTSPGLLIIDEIGYMPMDKEGRDLFFQVISKRSETGSMIATTNKAFKDWTEIFQDNAVATAIAERLIEHGELVKIEGSSYRVKKRKQRNTGL